jgi:hypothetical protein
LLGVWVVTAIDRTAYPRFKRVVPERELVKAFTPTVAEVAWAREKTQNDQHLLALVVWLKSHQRLGYFPKLDEVPAVGPLEHANLNVLGRYSFRASTPAGGSLRPLRDPATDNADEDEEG